MQPSPIQPQETYNIPYILGPHFSNLNYLLKTKELPSAPDKIYNNNQELWEAVLYEQQRAHATLLLDGFYLFEWFPRSPGLYYTSDASWIREEAFRHLDDSFTSAPVGIDHARGDQKDHNYKLVFTPQGKASMLQGGVGCIRLKSFEKDGTVLWLMSASSTPVAHEGFPVAVPNELYQACIGEIAEKGAMSARITGELKFLDDTFSNISGFYTAVPQLYLEVTEIQPLPDPGSSKNLFEVSVAVSFVSNYERDNGVYASYVTFRPGQRDSFRIAIDWLKEEYVEGAYKGRIITDFDQTRTHFREAALSLRKVMGRHLTRGEVREAIELMHAHGDVEELFNALELEELANNVSSPARMNVFISYCHADKQWLDRLQTHLRPLTRNFRVDLWEDRQLRPGGNWRAELENSIESAKAAILIISADFMASNFISEFELPKLLSRHREGGLTVLPLIASDSRYRDIDELEQIQAVNDPDQPLNTLSKGVREQVLVDVSKKIEKLLV